MKLSSRRNTERPLNDCSEIEIKRKSATERILNQMFHTYRNSTAPSTNQNDCYSCEH